jgi:hypothetical protein
MPTTDDKYITIRNAATFLNHLQILINHIGDYLTGSDYRTTGHSPDFVRQRCSLIIKNVGVGSLEAELELADKQETLSDVPSLGEASIETFYKILQKISEGHQLEDNLNKMLVHKLHRRRIIEDIFKIWPDEHDGYAVELFSDASPVDLKPDRKLTLEGLLSHLGTQQETSVKGVLGTLGVMPQKIMQIVGPDGKIKCHFRKEQEEAAKRLIGKPVIVYGEATFDAEGNVREMVNVGQLKQFAYIELQRIFSEKEELQLQEPIIVSVDYRDDRWVMENEELGITATALDYDKSIRNFNDEFLFLWKEYGKEQDINLSIDARRLKDKIQQYIKIDSAS